MLKCAMIEQESQSGEERRKRNNEEERYKSVLEVAGFLCRKAVKDQL